LYDLINEHMQIHTNVIGSLSLICAWLFDDYASIHQRRGTIDFMYARFLGNDFW
jgi:hypothetical protein